MIVLFTLLGFIGLVVLAFIADNRDYKRANAECEAKLKAWLEEEMAKPKYHVYVLTKTAKIYVTEVFEPSIRRYLMLLDWRSCTNTSLQNATYRIVSSIKSGCFHDVASNTFIPLCEIEYMQAKQAEGENAPLGSKSE